MRQAGVVLLALLVPLVLVACDDGKDESDRSKDSVSSKQLCDGALSGDAGQAMEAVSGANEFSQLSSEDGVQGVAESIAEEYSNQGAATAKDHSLCQVYSSQSGAGFDLEITYSLADETSAAVGGEDPDFAKYEIGRKALAKVDEAVLYYECASNKLPGSDSSPAIIRGELKHRHEPEGNPQKLRENNLTILHSASLSLAKNLGCEKNGQLLAKPAFTPVP
ncbi:hypothetical protein [Streptomyces lunaelactis]|uniref:hypothetical protein n=1 Tax=Streptomyces lunaelactis TaxID=1535768 RepID=UPI001C307EC6|nr:hypothetical protein [Streptomyces lunaelactis]NUK86468.1 hypothetical protein [Streptomyces lunaelactis]